MSEVKVGDKRVHVDRHGQLWEYFAEHTVRLIVDLDGDTYVVSTFDDAIGLNPADITPMDEYLRYTRPA